jgi:hypothetical protein
VCLNTFDPHKGYDTLLDACSLLQKKRQDFKVDLYGTGGELNAIKLKTKNIGLEEIVRFFPRTRNVESVYKNAFCLINPSYIEPFGMTLIEAMAQKTPVIAARSGGPDEFIEHTINGLLYPVGDASALSRCMEGLLDRPDSARKLGEAGYKMVLEKFNGDRAREQFVEVIRHAMDGFNGYCSSIQTQCALFELLWEDHYLPGVNDPIQQLACPQKEDDSLSQNQYMFAQQEKRNQENENILRRIRQEKIQQIASARSSRFHKLTRLAKWVSFVRHPDNLDREFPPAFKPLQEDSCVFIPSIKKYLLQGGEYLNGLDFQEYLICFNRPNLNGVLVAPILEIPATNGTIGLEIVSPQQKIITQVVLPLQNVSGHIPIKFTFSPIPATRSGIWRLRVFVREADTSVKLYELERVSFLYTGWLHRQPFFGYTFLEQGKRSDENS